MDLRALLAKNARTYGSRPAVLAALPIRFSGAITMFGKTGSFELVEGRKKYRETRHVGGMVVADGIDGSGAWTYGLAGVAVRLGDEEAIDERLERWIEERSYLVDLLRARAHAVAKCAADERGKPRVTVTTEFADLGDPTLIFDAGGALLSVSYTHGGGFYTEKRFRWSSAGAGVRWPVERSFDRLGGLIAVEETRRQTPGLGPCGAHTCFAPPPSSLGLSTRSATTRVPMSFYMSELSVRADVGGRKVFAFLDSGASPSALDATSPLGAAFKPTLSMKVLGATQTSNGGLGFIQNVSLGGLSIRRLPVVSVPIPALDEYGARRPELMLGLSLFLARAIRIDYAKGELVLASNAKSLLGPAAVKVRLRF